MAFPLFAPRRQLTLGDASVSPFPERSGPGRSGLDPLPANKRLGFARGREVAALLLWTAAIFLALALASYVGDPSAPPPPEGGVLPPGAVAGIVGANWVGPVGASCARAAVSTIGVMAWVLPLELVLLGIPYVRGKKTLITPARMATDFLAVVIAAAMVQVGWPAKTAFGLHPASGMIGELFGEIGRSLFSTIGSFLVGFACLGLLLIARASFSFIAMMNSLGRLGAQGARGTADGARSVADAWRTAREIEREKQEEERLARLPHIDETNGNGTVVALSTRASRPNESPLAPAAEIDLATACLSAGDSVEPVAKRRPPRKKRDLLTKDGLPANDDAALGGKEDAQDKAAKQDKPADKPDRRRKTEKGIAQAGATSPLGDLPLMKDDLPPPDAADVPAIVFTNVAADADLSSPSPPPALAKRPEAGGAKAASEPEPLIVDTSAALEKVRPAPVQLPLEKVLPSRAFRLPSIEFLIQPPVTTDVSVDKDVLYRTADVLIKTLADYKILGKVEDILPGPTVTTFEVSPAAGTKVSRVAALADDLALALAKKVRIVAPIPGKNRIGFELPNEKRVPLFVRDLIEDRRFQEFDVPLPVVLGRDIVGKPVYADLASMPHVIVAGATGAGKSVGLNVMLTSLLYRRTPEELRLLMIDPKVVELAPFDRIPHMLLPVVTDMKQAANALKWAVDEMERRYQLFADAGTRNIGTYNGWADKVARGVIKNPNAKVVLSKDFNGFTDAIPAEKGSDEGEAPLPEKLPYIVIVVDEFADLMMQQKGDVEVSVARLAQKARAAGMHVILATQRPSVDVITGMIKANFPSRIAFRVAQRTDSRTILDEQGAEHLLGKGDMLIKMNGTNDTKRVQCPFLSEEEVQAVTDFLRTQGEPVYDENILKPRDDDPDAPAAEEDGELDAMYDQAVRLVAETGRCSTSWLQRKLEIGYNRAARIVETMERRGLVGPPNGAKDREVFSAPI
jgi:S-DNA-T family DNA segregation ATPase FtsK/SpoIIIE